MNTDSLSRTVRYRFSAAIDATGVVAQPAEVVVGFDDGVWPACELLEIGSGGGAGEFVDRTQEVLLPAFVNAHTHLDLTHIGPRAYDPADGFDSWLKMILAERLHEGEQIRRSVREGIERCLAGGIVAVGDIAGIGRKEAVEELRRSILVGESYVEYFGLGDRQWASAEAMAGLARQMEIEANGVRLGLSPHAPYTAGPGLYGSAATIGNEASLALCTHLAESMAERRFVQDADGPMRDLIDELGVLDDVALREFGRGEKSVSHLREALAAASWVLAHVCDVTDEEIGVLAGLRSSVAYCPRSSAYFGHHDELGPHRYRDMLAAGINVCLGTDSIVNLPMTSRGKPPTLGVLDEMRFLHERDGTDPLVLLGMGTVNGAAALRLEPSRFLLTPGEKAGLTAVRASTGTIEAVLGSTAHAELLRP